MSETFGLALYCHPAAADDDVAAAEGEAVAVTKNSQKKNEALHINNLNLMTMNIKRSDFNSAPQPILF